MTAFVEDADPGMAAGYERYRGKLLATLGRMAAAGYPVAPGDGLELVHDFFVEAWPGLQARYDPTKGTFVSYLLGAFVRFVRPRIVRSAKWRESLLPPEDIARAAERAGSRTEQEEVRDLALVRKALETLLPLQRAVLEERVGFGRSEREVARAFNLSRYKLRETCIEALGRLAVAIDEPGVIGTADWPLARTLWGGESSLLEATAALGLDREQARTARQRIFDSISAALMATGARGRERRRIVMTDLCSLWRKLIANPGDVELAEQARARAYELLEHVEDCDACFAAGESAEDVAALYEAIAPAEAELTEEDSRTLEDLLVARREDDAAVARAVEEVLLPSLGRELGSLEAIGPDLTPLTLFLATDAVALLVRRTAGPDEPQSVVMTSDGAIRSALQVLVAPEVVIREIAHVAGISLETAERLAKWWIPRAASHQPHLFLGVDCVSLPNGQLRMTPSLRRADEDLFNRWMSPDLMMTAGRFAGPEMERAR